MMANRLKIMCNIGGDDCVAAKDLCVSACHKDFLQSHFVGKWWLGSAGMLKFVEDFER